VDVAIVAGRVRDPGLLTLEVARNPLIALVPSAHRLARRRRVPLSSLAGEPFVLFPRDQIPSVYDDILRLCRSAGFEPHVAQLAQSWHMIATLVRLGLGVSVVPAAVRRYFVRGTQPIAVSPSGTVTTTMAWRSGANSAPTLQLVELTRELLRRPRRPARRRLQSPAGHQTRGPRAAS
jgi:DNA-binding transcriptional LysR family regulator